MTKLALKQQSILPRIDGISADITRLRKLASLPREEFVDLNKDHVDVAKTRIREALEGVFNIGAHILARIEGARATEFKEIAKKLGEIGIVDKNFANTTLTYMAGYRNRLTHFYADVDEIELYDILQKHLNDFETFLTHIKKLLEHPEKFGLTVE
jgi:uncharacterized protein YutE (UPF0331/DUF86 family)